MPRGERGFLKDAIRRHLVEADPSLTTRNRFRLRRPSEYAEYELRIDPWRIFYRIREDVVEIIMVGITRGNRLLIDGEEFVL